MTRHWITRLAGPGEGIELLPRATGAVWNDPASLTFEEERAAVEQVGDDAEWQIEELRRHVHLDHRSESISVCTTLTDTPRDPARHRRADLRVLLSAERGRRSPQSPWLESLSAVRWYAAPAPSCPAGADD